MGAHRDREKRFAVAEKFYPRRVASGCRSAARPGQSGTDSSSDGATLPPAAGTLIAPIRGSRGRYRPGGRHPRGSMVQLFQRYIPYSSVVHFLVQTLLCLTAFTLVVQVAWYAQLDPTLPSMTGVRLGRTATTVATLVIVFYLTGYFRAAQPSEHGVVRPPPYSGSAALSGHTGVAVRVRPHRSPALGGGRGRIGPDGLDDDRVARLGPAYGGRGYAGREHPLDRRRRACVPDRRSDRQRCSLGIPPHWLRAGRR